MAYSVDDLTDFTFNVIPLPLKENPQDEYFLEDMFFFEVTCTTLVVPPHVMSQNYLNDDGDYDESWIYDADSDDVEHTFSVERRRLLDEPEEISMSTLEGLLASNGINPVEGFMVDKILRVGRDMARDYSYLGRKVLHLGVHHIELLPTQEYNNNNNNINININIPTNDGGSSNDNHVVAEGLKKVRVVIMEGDDERLCAICLEKLLVGSEATELPCSHLYHGGCIVKWLEKHSDCPLCRKRAAST